MNHPSSPPRLARLPELLLRVASLVLCLGLTAAARANVPEKNYDISAGDAALTLKLFVAQSGEQVVYLVNDVRGVQTNAITGTLDTSDALFQMLAGTGLAAREDEKTGALTVIRPALSHAESATAPAADSAKKDEVVKLSPFDVSASSATGYEGTSSVSGTRLDTPLVDLSKNITVMTRDFIDDQQVTELSHSFDYTADVQGGQSDSGIMMIRGFGGNSPKRDGLGIYGGDESIYDTATIDRIEIVKGPSALLYGVSSPGGVINYITKEPLPVEESSLRLMSGSWDRDRFELDTGGPLIGDGDTLNQRLIVAGDENKSYAAYFKQQRATLAETLRWFISKNTYLTFGAEDNIVRGTENRPFTGLFDRAIYEPNGTVIYNAYFDPNPIKFMGATPYTVQDTDVKRIDLDLSHNFTDTLNLYIHYNYLSNNLVDAGEPTMSEGQSLDGTVPVGQDQFQYAMYFRIPHRTTNDGTITLKDEFKNNWARVEVVAGAEFFHYGLTFEQDSANSWPVLNFVTGAGYDVPIPNTITEVDQAISAGTWSFQFRYFEHEDYDSPYLLTHTHLFDDRLRIVLGVRRDEIRDGQIFYPAASTTADPFATGAPTFTNYNTTATTPLIGVSYQPFEHVPGFTLYGNYSKSLQPNEVVNQVTGKGLPPQHGDGYEAGAKLDLTNKLFVQWGIYEIDKSGVPYQVPNSIPAQWLASGLERSKGTDIDLFYSPQPGWQIIGSAAYTDARYVSDNGTSLGVPLDGTRLNFVPYWKWASWTKYTFQSGKAKGFSLGGGVVSSGSSIYQVPYLLHYPSYTKFDALVGYTTKINGHKTEFEFKVNNVFNKAYIENAQGVGDPRNWQASVTYHF